MVTKLQSCSGLELIERDPVAMASRKAQLKRLDALLNDPDYFDNERTAVGAKGSEPAWQRLFERMDVSERHVL